MKCGQREAVNVPLEIGSCEVLDEISSMVSLEEESGKKTRLWNMNSGKCVFALESAVEVKTSSIEGSVRGVYAKRNIRKGDII